MTILDWVKWTVPTNDVDVFFNKRVDAGGEDALSPYQLFAENRTAVGGTLPRLRFFVGNGSTSLIVEGTSTIVTDTLHCLVCRISGTTMELFLDGVSEATTTFTGTRQTNVADVRIGRYRESGSRFDFDGIQSNWVLWASALTNNQIKALANGVNPFSIDPTNINANLPIWGNQSPEPDYTGKAHTGTVTGTTKAVNPPVELIENYL